MVNSKIIVTGGLGFIGTNLILNLIKSKYKVLNEIGSGSFGYIYKAKNIRTNSMVAIKTENIKNGSKLLKNETIVYQYLSGLKGVPNVLYFGKDECNYYMVLVEKWKEYLSNILIKILFNRSLTLFFQR